MKVLDPLCNWELEFCHHQPIEGQPVSAVEATNQVVNSQ